MNLFGKMSKLQQALTEVSARLHSLEASSESGGGLIKVTVIGAQRVKTIEIDPAIFTVDDREMLEDLLVAAVNQALEAVAEKAKSHTQEIAKSMAPPGTDLDNLFG